MRRAAATSRRGPASWVVQRSGVPSARASLRPAPVTTMPPPSGPAGQPASNACYMVTWVSTSTSGMVTARNRPDPKLFPKRSESCGSRSLRNCYGDGFQHASSSSPPHGRDRAARWDGRLSGAGAAWPPRRLPEIPGLGEGGAWGGEWLDGLRDQVDDQALTFETAADEHGRDRAGDLPVALPRPGRADHVDQAADQRARAVGGSGQRDGGAGAELVEAGADDGDRVGGERDAGRP
jgi:hypothetical protein